MNDLSLKEEISKSEAALAKDIARQLFNVGADDIQEITATKNKENIEVVIIGKTAIEAVKVSGVLSLE